MAKLQLISVNKMTRHWVSKRTYILRQSESSISDNVYAFDGNLQHSLPVKMTQKAKIAIRFLHIDRHWCWFNVALLRLIALVAGMHISRVFLLCVVYALYSKLTSCGCVVYCSRVSPNFYSRFKKKESVFRFLKKANPNHWYTVINLNLWTNSVKCETLDSIHKRNCTDGQFV